MKSLLTISIACFVASTMHVYASTLIFDGKISGQIDQCVEQTYNKFIAESQSLCVGQSHYYDSGGNQSSNTQTIRYGFPENMSGYRFRAGTGATNVEGGACVFEIHANVESEQSFSCIWYTKGCGFTKGGGHVKGYCSVEIEYIPKLGDVINIKNYCLAKYTGGLIPPLPTSRKIGCNLP